MPITARALRALPRAELVRLMRDGTMPRIADLAGYEFRGLNLPRITRLLGIQKFRKGFYLHPGEDPAGTRAHGYNVAVRQDGPGRPWVAKPDERAPKRHGFYDVYPASESPRWSAYPRALLIDYAVAENGGANPETVIRDYLIQPDADNPELYLGYAHLALGPVTVSFGFFTLERFAPVDYVGPGEASSRKASTTRS